MGVAIWWIRRDLRLSDNPALTRALETAGTVTPLFIIDTDLLKSPYFSQRRFDFLLTNLASLADDLARKGGKLIVRRGPPLDVLREVLRETGATMIYAERDVSPYASKRDRAIQEHLPVTFIGSPSILEPGTVRKLDGAPYTVFTPFSKSWNTVYQKIHPVLLPAPERIPGVDHLETLGVSLQHPWDASFQFPAGERAANRRLHEFQHSPGSGMPGYDLNRDRIDLEGTSRISPYLRFGILSPRLAASIATQNFPGTRGAESWLNELIWRDFYIHTLSDFPHVRQVNFRDVSVKWIHDPAGLDAWKHGYTGYPIVDAAMRCLSATGWMHNRARMITASFLTKHLLINWQEGERWFMQQLLDGDPAANNGGWQWVAGTGTDAAPYFRIFNPTIQGAKFDPQGRFIKTWIPELARVPEKYIHQPWMIPPLDQVRAGFRVGRDYPNPIIDHAFARQRTLKAWEKLP